MYMVNGDVPEDAVPVERVPDQYFWHNAQGFGFDVRNLSVLLRTNFRNVNPHTVASAEVPSGRGPNPLHWRPGPIWCNARDLGSLLAHPHFSAEARRHVEQRTGVLNQLSTETKRQLAWAAGELYTVSYAGFCQWLRADAERLASVLPAAGVDTPVADLLREAHTMHELRRHATARGMRVHLAAQASEHNAEPSNVVLGSDLYRALEFYKAGVASTLLEHLLGTAERLHRVEREVQQQVDDYCADRFAEVLAVAGAAAAHAARPGRPWARVLTLTLVDAARADPPPATAAQPPPPGSPPTPQPNATTDNVVVARFQRGDAEPGREGMSSVVLVLPARNDDAAAPRNVVFVRSRSSSSSTAEAETDGPANVANDMADLGDLWLDIMNAVGDDAASLFPPSPPQQRPSSPTSTPPPPSAPSSPPVPPPTSASPPPPARQRPPPPDRATAAIEAARASVVAATGLPAARRRRALAGGRLGGRRLGRRPGRAPVTAPTRPVAPWQLTVYVNVSDPSMYAVTEHPAAPQDTLPRAQVLCHVQTLVAAHMQRVDPRPVTVGIAAVTGAVAKRLDQTHGRAHRIQLNRFLRSAVLTWVRCWRPSDTLVCHLGQAICQDGILMVTPRAGRMSNMAHVLSAWGIRDRYLRNVARHMALRAPEIYEWHVVQRIQFHCGFDDYRGGLVDKLRSALRGQTCIQDLAGELCEFLSVPYAPEDAHLYARFQCDHSNLAAPLPTAEEDPAATALDEDDDSLLGDGPHTSTAEDDDGPDTSTSTAEDDDGPDPSDDDDSLLGDESDEAVVDDDLERLLGDESDDHDADRRADEASRQLAAARARYRQAEAARIAWLAHRLEGVRLSDGGASSETGGAESDIVLHVS